MGMVDVKATGYVKFAKSEGGKTNFLLNLSKKKKDGTYERGSVRCTAWDGGYEGQVVEDQLVDLEGYGWPRTYTDKDGKKVTTFEVTAKSVTSRDVRNNTGGKLPGKSPEPAAAIDVPEDPF